jgi:hypothetical protein
MARPTDAEPAEPPSLAEAVGGPVGMAETSLPAVAFVVAYSASGSDTDTAAIVAVGLAIVLAVARTAMGLPLFALGLWLTWRLVRRPPPEPAPAAG